MSWAYKAIDTGQKSIRNKADRDQLMETWLRDKSLPIAALNLFKDPFLNLVEDLKNAGFQVDDAIQKNNFPLPRRQIVVSGIETKTNKPINILTITIDVEVGTVNDKPVPDYNFSVGSVRDLNYTEENLRFRPTREINNAKYDFETIQYLIRSNIEQGLVLPVNPPTPKKSFLKSLFG